MFVSYVSELGAVNWLWYLWYKARLAKFMAKI